MGLKRSLFNAVNVIARQLTDRSQTCRQLAWELYVEMTKSRERWMPHRGMPLLVNIYDRGIGTRLYLGRGYGGGRITEMERVIRPGDRVIDLGANIGYFTLLMARLVGPTGRVYAFEPDPRCAGLIKRSLERNGFHNTVIEQKAVSNANAQMTFHLHDSWTSNALAAIDGSVGEVTVPVVALDDYLADADEIKFVKMDIDGSEPLVIEGMKKTIKRSKDLHILTEYQPGNLKRYYGDPLDFLTTARDLGLELEAILDTERGRLPGLDVEPLRRVPENGNLDLLFVRMASRSTAF